MNRRLLALTFVVAFAALAGAALAARPTKRLDDVERGKQLYERHCVQCHGPGVAGDGAAAGALVARVPDLRGGRLNDANQEGMVIVVLDGKGPMPSFETSFDRYEARRLLRYMQTLAEGKAEAAEEPEAPAVPEPPSAPEPE